MNNATNPTNHTRCLKNNTTQSINCSKKHHNSEKAPSTKPNNVSAFNIPTNLKPSMVVRGRSIYKSNE